MDKYGSYGKEVNPYAFEQYNSCGGQIPLDLTEILGEVKTNISEACVIPELVDGNPTGVLVLRLILPNEMVFNVTGFCESVLPDFAGVDYSACIDPFSPNGYVDPESGPRQYFIRNSSGEDGASIDFAVQKIFDNYFVSISNGIYLRLLGAKPPKDLPPETLIPYDDLIRLVNSGGFILPRGEMEKKDQFWEIENTPTSPESAAVSDEATQIGLGAVTILLSLIVITIAGGSFISSAVGKVGKMLEKKTMKEKGIEK